MKGRNGTTILRHAWNHLWFESCRMDRRDTQRYQAVCDALKVLSFLKAAKLSDRCEKVAA